MHSMSFNLTAANTDVIIHYSVSPMITTRHCFVLTHISTRFYGDTPSELHYVRRAQGLPVQRLAGKRIHRLSAS